MIETLHAIVSSLCDLILVPFARCAPLWALLWISALTSVFVLWSYKLFSNQREIQRVKDLIKASLLELRLFKDDPVLTGRSIGDLLVTNLRYLRLNIVPFAVMVVPIVLLIIHMDMRFGRRPLLPGEPTLLKLTLSGTGTLDPFEEIKIEAPEGLSIETAPVYVPALKEVSWRVRALRPGTYPLRITVADQSVTKNVIVSDRLAAASSISVRAGFMNRLLHPTLPPLSIDRLSSIELVYPSRTIRIFGSLTLHWILLFFILTIVLGFSLKGLFGVQL